MQSDLQNLLINIEPKLEHPDELQRTQIVDQYETIQIHTEQDIHVLVCSDDADCLLVSIQSQWFLAGSQFLQSGQLLNQ